MNTPASSSDHTAAQGNCEVVHSFGQGNPLAERRTRWVMWITLVVMVVEITVGWAFNSMALLADGWHMSSHALALGLTVFAYRMAARFARDRRFTFGTWKIEVLGGYTSSLLLVGVALTMLVESLERLVHPLPIGYNQAIGTAVFGLLVNLVSAWMLKDDHHHHHHHGHGHGHGHGGHSHGHDDGQDHQHGHEHGHEHSHGHDHGHAHGHAHEASRAHAHGISHAHAPAHDHGHADDHDHDHEHGHEHHITHGSHHPTHGHEASSSRAHGLKATHTDLNLRAAYIHVLTDAATSILAIVALFAGKWWGAAWLDPVMGIVGAVVVAIWARGLLMDCARVLLDAEMDGPLVGAVRRTLHHASGQAVLKDLHIWRVAHDKYACIVALDLPAGPEEACLSPADFRQLLQSRHAELVHVTVEVNACAT